MKSRAWRLYGSVILLGACASSHEVHTLAVQQDQAGTSAVTITAPVEATGLGLCARLATLQCDAEQHCCSAPGRSRETCESAWKNDCEQSSHLDDVAMKPITGFDAAAADGVFAQLESKLQACDPDVVRWSVSQDGLRSLFKGTVASGQSCKPQQLINSDTTEQAAALLSCLDASRTACLPASLLGDWTCSSKSKLGGNCVSDDNCETDAYCDTPAQAIFGTCTARSDLGAACSGATQCQSFNCDGGTCKAPDVQTAFCPSA